MTQWLLVKVNSEDDKERVRLASEEFYPVEFSHSPASPVRTLEVISTVSSVVYQEVVK